MNASSAYSIHPIPAPVLLPRPLPAPTALPANIPFQPRAQYVHAVSLWSDSSYPEWCEGNDTGLLRELHTFGTPSILVNCFSKVSHRRELRCRVLIWANWHGFCVALAAGMGDRRLDHDALQQIENKKIESRSNNKTTRARKSCIKLPLPNYEFTEQPMRQDNSHLFSSIMK